MHTFIERDEYGTTVFFVSALVAATMLTVLTATGAEAKCKTLRLPSGERFASCGRVPRVISHYGDIYVGRGWVIGGDRYSQRKGSGYLASLVSACGRVPRASSRASPVPPSTRACAVLRTACAILRLRASNPGIWS